MNRKREKIKSVRPAGLKTRRELQLHHNHEKFLIFDCAVALCTMQNAFLVISNLTLAKIIERMEMAKKNWLFR
jgi:hypothetical protein